MMNWHGRVFRLVLGGCLMGSALVRAAESVPGEGPSGDVVVLPPIFVVETAEQAAQWKYVSVPGFEVLTKANTTTTREFIRGAVEAQQLLAAMVPEDLHGSWSAPQIALLATPDQAVAVSQQFLQDYSQEDEGTIVRINGRRIPIPGPAGIVPGAVGPLGIAPYAAPPVLQADVVRVRVLSNVRLADLDFVGTYAEADHRYIHSQAITLSTAAVQAELEARTPALPPWYIAGVLSLYANSARVDTHLLLPPLVWDNPAVTQSLRRDADYPRALLSLVDLLEREPPARDDSIFPLWEAQSALLVRWGLDERNEIKEPFWNFVRQLADGVAPAQASRDSLRLTLADLQDRLSDYLPQSSDKSLELSAPRMPRVSVPNPRPATPAEVARIRGDIERMEIADVAALRPEFAGRYIDQAEQTLSAGYAAGVRDPEFLGVLGLFDVDIGKDPAAQPYLEAAVAANVSRPRLYLELARIRYVEAAASPEAPEDRLSVAQAAPILELLESAHALQPPVVDVYLLAAEVLRNRVATEGPFDWSLLDAGLRAFPRDPRLLEAVALLKGAYGRSGEARDLVERALRLDLTPENRARFEEIRAALPAP